MWGHNCLGGVMRETRLFRRRNAETQMVRWCNAGDVNITHYAT